MSHVSAAAVEGETKFTVELENFDVQFFDSKVLGPV